MSENDAFSFLWSPFSWHLISQISRLRQVHLNWLLLPVVCPAVRSYSRVFSTDIFQFWGIYAIDMDLFFFVQRFANSQGRKNLTVCFYSNHSSTLYWMSTRFHDPTHLMPPQWVWATWWSIFWDMWIVWTHWKFKNEWECRKIIFRHIHF